MSVVVSAPSPAQVQQVQTVFPGTVATTAVGPYYVTPSWPQQRPAAIASGFMLVG